MKNLKNVFAIAIILCCMVQAQTVGSWRYVPGNPRSAIVNQSISDSSSGALILRCDSDLFEVFLSSFVEPAPKINVFESATYKIDDNPIQSFNLEKSATGDLGFFPVEIIKKIIPEFLNSHYFSISLSNFDRIRAYTFDLTGFKQILEYIPCAEKYFSPQSNTQTSVKPSTNSTTTNPASQPIFGSTRKFEETDFCFLYKCVQVTSSEQETYRYFHYRLDNLAGSDIGIGISKINGTIIYADLLLGSIPRKNLSDYQIFLEFIYMSIGTSIKFDPLKECGEEISSIAATKIVGQYFYSEVNGHPFSIRCVFPYPLSLTNFSPKGIEEQSFSIQVAAVK